MYISAGPSHLAGPPAASFSASADADAVNNAAGGPAKWLTSDGQKYAEATILGQIKFLIMI